MLLTVRQLILRYTAFAVFATLANLAIQRIALEATGGRYVPALIAGTLAGLVVKFALDKRWIFYDDRGKLGVETRKFGLYALTGVGTTAIFWGSETLFWIVGETQKMREVGAVIGLVVGYVIKYQLDCRFVFVYSQAAGKGPSCSKHD